MVSSPYLNPIRARRQAAGMSQSQLGAATGIPQTRISALERGATRDELRRLARVLGVTEPESLLLPVPVSSDKENGGTR